MSNLLKEAIADTKTLTETAKAEAMKALQEAFSGDIKSVLATKLSELAEDDFSDLTESDELEETVEELEETQEIEESEEIDEVENLDESEEEINLEELAAEISEALSEEDEDENESVDETFKNQDIDFADEKDIASNIYEEGEMEEEINLDELFEEDDSEEDVDESNYDLEELFEEEDEETVSKEEYEALQEQLSLSEKAITKLTNQLKEAAQIIKSQKAKINESTLYASKLLYLNKLLSENSLTKEMKNKVKSKINEAETAKEAKLVYNTLNEALKMSNSRIVESSASKPIGTTKTQIPLNEGIVTNDFISRMQKLANIKTN